MTSLALKESPAVTYGGGGGRPSAPKGPAKVIPFPVLRRVGFLDRMAWNVSTCRDVDRYMAHILSNSAKPCSGAALLAT
jgi:hypothetical protein